jgi:hypothetical protein
MSEQALASFAAGWVVGLAAEIWVVNSDDFTDVPPFLSGPIKSVLSAYVMGMPFWIALGFWWSRKHAKRS